MALRTATNPQTGERVAFVMGEWVPYRPDQTAPADQTTPPADQPPEEPSALQTYVTDPLKRGVGALGQAAGAIGAKTGIISPETAAGIIVKSNAFAEAAKRRPQDEAALKEIGDAPDLKSAAVAALKHPSAWLLTMMESLPQSSLSILGGLFGSVLGPAGTAGGAGAGSAATEYSASLIQAMQNLNVDLRDPKAVENALTSPRFMEYASQYAAKRAAGVGALDAVGGGVAGRLVGGARGVGSTVVRGAGEGAVQAGTGAAGEAIGQRNVGEYKPGDIVMEAAAELPVSIGDVVTGAAHTRRKAAAGAGGATLPGGAATTGKPVTGTAPAATPSGTKPPPPAIGAPPAVIPPVTVPTEVGPAPAPIPTAQPAPATAAPIAPQATGGTAAPKTTAGASPIVKKAAANLAKILPETWDPVHADPDDPNSPVLAYHNESTGETRTPDQHLAPIVTPLSGFEPVIAPPSVIAEQVARAKEEGRKEVEKDQPVAPKVAPVAVEAAPVAPAPATAAVKAVETKLAAEQTVAAATAARSEANAFRPTHTDTQTGKPVEVEVSGPVRRVKYADGTTREERAVKAADRYQPIGAAVPEVPNVSEAPAANKPSAPIVSQPGRPDPQKGIDRKKANAEAAARPLPTMAEINAAADQAADPTPAQAESGNYKKGHLQLHGIDISVETPRGGVRRGVGSDGKPWETKLQFPYGYIKKTKGADGEQVDTYLAGREPHAYVVDQIDPATGAFDETKTVMGTRNEKRARAVYEAGFSDKSGKKRLGAITPMTIDAYKDWLANGDHSKPVAYQAPLKTSGKPRKTLKTPEPALETNAEPAAAGTVNPSPPAPTPKESFAVAEPAATSKESLQVDHGEMVPPGGFRTSKGSTYTRDGESTQRTKTLHQGHDPKDVGLKKPSERTVYVDPEAAREAGMHGTLSGRKAIVVRGNQAMLVSWNDAAKDWGRAPSTKPIPFTTEPGVGRAPLEFWKGSDDKRGRLYSNWHAGNEIVELGATPKPDLEVAPVRDTPSPAAYKVGERVRLNDAMLAKFPDDQRPGEASKVYRVKRIFSDGSGLTIEADDTTSRAVRAQDVVPAKSVVPVRDTPSPKPAATESYGTGNKVFTADAAAKARARLKAKLSGSQLNAGFDPELMLDGLTLAGFHVEAGARTFAAYSKAILGDLGEGARPYLAYWYNAVRDYPGFDTAGMDSREAVERETAPAPAPAGQPAATTPKAGASEPVATEAPPRASQAPARKPRVRKVPVSIMEFVASRGGIAMKERSEVNIDRKFAPGFGPIFRKNGTPLDRLREAAVEAGYLPPDATVDDLVDLIERDAGGNRQYADADVNAAEDIRQGKVAADEQRREQEARDAVADYAVEAGLELTPDEISMAAEAHLARGADLADAVDFVVENSAQQIDYDTEQLGDPIDDIPWEWPPLAEDGGEGPGEAGGSPGLEGGASAGQAAPEEGAAAGGQEPAAGARPLKVEKGAEGLDQFVLPGAEPSAAQVLAARKGKGLKGKGRQQTADEGLFAPPPDTRQEDIEGARGSGQDLERDSGDAAAGDRLGAADVPAAGRGAGDGAGTRGGEAGAQPDTGDRGGFVPGSDAALLGADRDQPLEGDDGQWHPGLADDREPGRGSGAGEPGPAVDTGAADAAAQLARKPATVKDRAAVQAAADQIKLKSGDPDNIRATLPLLQPEQQDDVIKAEARYAKPDGHGFMLTNGTGTGKTYSGLGVIKRFARQGKDNILILAPSQGILDGWIAAGADLGLTINRLDSATTAGKGIVATTYANFRDNRHLGDRDWDLITADESHQLAQNQAGDETGSLNALRALTYHPDRLHARARMQLRELADEIDARQAEIKALSASDDQRSWAAAEKKSAELAPKLKELTTKTDAAVAAMKAKPRGKVLFLSATPFPYVKTVDYGQGYLFHYQGEKNPGGYNQPDPRGAFFMQHFGYRMHTGKLTEPEAGVNSEVMEREFHEWLKREGSLSGRALTVDKDYDRKFVLVDDAIGNRIDQALDFLREAEDGRYRDIYDLVYKQFDYLARMRLLEAIKAQHAIPIIRQHHDLGRKVVVFHDYNEGGGLNPFEVRIPEDALSHKTGEKLSDVYADFHAKNPDVRKLKFASLGSPLSQLTKAFPDALIYNGNVTGKLRATARKLFNTDGPGGRNLIIVQSAAGEAGISLHDTTGQHQRVTLNLGMPVRPVTAIQEEGRIYRVGQKSDAVQRYMSTGTNWERWTFAGKIAERAGTAENLAMGENARAMKQAFVDAFADADTYPASPEDGTGGKDLDRATNMALSPFERAKTFYFAQAKQRGRRDQREGADYFPTPEPLGLKMVEWANIKVNDDVLEPSAGHGAIARFFPETSRRTLVEPSGSLASRAALSSPGASVVADRFENLHISRKYDAIVMNPPFGSGGKTAMEHLAKAAKHLRNGGRIVALLPDGGMATKRFEQFMDSEDAKGVYLVADLKMPAILFERAGTAVRSHVVVLERQNDAAVADQLQQSNREYEAEKIGDLFDRIQDATVKPRAEPATKEVKAPEPGGTVTIRGVELQLQGASIAVIRNKLTKPQFADAMQAARNNGGSYASKGFFFPTGEARQAFLDELANPKPVPAPGSMAVDAFTLGETVHGKTGDKLWVASIKDRVSKDEYTALAATAKRQGGWYSAFAGRGAIPGFQFKSEEARKAFLAETSGADPLSFTSADLDQGRTQLVDAPATTDTDPAATLGRTLTTGKLSDPEWAKIRKALDADLALMARQLAGSRIQTSAIDSIMLDGAAGRYIGGTQLRNLVTVSLLDADGNLRSYEDLLGTLRHEVIHFLKASGVIPRGSWAALESSARTWRQTFGIDDAYAYQNLTEAQLDEEAIAEAYNHWGKGQLKLDPVRATGMRAIARFLGAIRDRVRKALGLERIPTPQEIFEAIERGDFAAANPEVGEDTIAKTHLPRSAASVVFSQDDIAGNMRQLEGLNYALIQKAMSAGMRGKAGSLIDHTRRVIQDRFLFVRRAEEAVEAATGAPLPEEAQPYLQEMLYRGEIKAAKMEIDHEFRLPILEAMQHAGLKLDEVENYLYALHAPERNRYIASINPKFPDGGSGMTNADAQATIDAVNAGPAEKRIALGQVRDLVRGMMERRLQIMQDSGLISAATAQTWRDTYQEYVPLRGVEADPDAEVEEALRPKVSRGFMGVRRLEPRAYGRGSRANHPLATAFMLADEAIVRAAKNEVQLAVLNLAQLAPDPNVWEVSPVKRQAYMATMADGTQQVRYRNMPHDDAKDTVIARIDGRPFRIQIHEPYMLRALSNLGAADLPSMMRWLATMTGTLSKLNTMWNPEFVITNAFMDAQAGLVNLGKEEQAGLRREVMGSYRKAMAGTWRYLKSGDISTEWSKHSQEFHRAGGVTAFNDIADVESQARSIEKQLAQLQNPRGFMANATKLVGVIERANTSIDNAMRLATFVALRNRGYSPAQAARVAKNLTINFNRKGELGPIANSLWMFSNAAIQGTATMVTALRHKGVRRFVYSAVALGVAMELMGGGWEPPEDDDGTGLSVYDRVPEWEKNTNLIFAYGPEPGQYIKIRTPYGYGFFVSLGRLSAAYMRGAKEATGDPVSLAMTLSKLASSFATNMLPGALTSGFVPTVAQPFADIASNSDWTGRAIMPNLFPGQNKPDSQLYYPSIDPYTKWTADMMNRLTGGNEFRPGMVDISPESMSHVIKTYAGAAGAFVVRSVSSITRAAGEATGSNEEDPALSSFDVPFWRKVVGSASPWQVKDITYQRLAELEILEDEAKGTTPAARAVRSAERRRLALVDDGRKLRRNLSDLRKERNRTIEDDKLSTPEKRARTDKIAEREKKLITRFNAAYSKAVSARPQ